MEAPFPSFTSRRPKRQESWSWGPAIRQKKKVEIIEVELQKLVRCGLDEVRVFHTLFHRRVAPLAESTRPMWKYNGLMDPDRASLEELLNDEVWSHLDQVLQLRPKETLDGKPGPLNAAMVSKLVCSPLSTPCSFPLCSPVFLF